METSIVLIIGIALVVVPLWVRQRFPQWHWLQRHLLGGAILAPLALVIFGMVYVFER